MWAAFAHFWPTFWLSVHATLLHFFFIIITFFCCLRIFLHWPHNKRQQFTIFIYIYIPTPFFSLSRFCDFASSFLLLKFFFGGGGAYFQSSSIFSIMAGSKWIRPEVFLSFFFTSCCYWFFFGSVTNNCSEIWSGHLGLSSSFSSLLRIDVSF